MKKTTQATIDKVYLFTGEIDSRRDREIADIVNSSVDQDFRIFDLEQISGDTTSATDIISAVTTIPMGSKRKVVVVDKVERLSDGEQAILAANIPRLSDSSCLILLCSDNSKSKRAPKSNEKQQKTDPQPDGDSSAEDTDSSEADAKSKGGGKGISAKLTNAVKSNGKLMSYTKMKGTELKPIIQQFVHESGKKIDPSALELLTRYLGPNPSAAEKEVEKLTAYLGDRETITDADVNEMVDKPDEDRVFPLIDAIASAQPGMAAQLLNETFAASSRPDQDVLKTISLLGRHFRILYQTRYLNIDARAAHLTPEEAGQFLMREQSPLSMQGWQADKLNAQSKSFSRKELQWCMKQILECELAVKGLGKLGGTPRLNLETLIFKLSLRRTAKR